MRRHRGAGLALVAGGGVAALLGRGQRDLPEVVLVLGVALLGAWVIERAGRFGSSGAVLAGLGGGLALAEHVAGLGPYRDELAFGGIALGLLVAAELLRGSLRGAGLGLAAVAISEVALQWLPAHVHAPRVFAAFEDGWGFGLLLMAEGVAVAVGLGRRRREVGPPSGNIAARLRRRPARSGHA